MLCYMTDTMLSYITCVVLYKMCQYVMLCYIRCVCYVI